MAEDYAPRRPKIVCPDIFVAIDQLPSEIGALSQWALENGIDASFVDLCWEWIEENRQPEDTDTICPRLFSNLESVPIELLLLQQWAEDNTLPPGSVELCLDWLRENKKPEDPPAVVVEPGAPTAAPTLAPTPLPIVDVTIPNIKILMEKVGTLSPEDIIVFEETMTKWWLDYFRGAQAVGGRRLRRRDSRDIQTEIEFVKQEGAYVYEKQSSVS